MHTLNNHNRKQLQRLQSLNEWLAVEEALKIFLLNNFASETTKRDNQFDTIWFAAEKEGGRRYLNMFLRFVEDEAHKVDTN